MANESAAAASTAPVTETSSDASTENQEASEDTANAVETQSQTSQPAKAAAPKQAEQKRMAKLKLKVDGKEIDEEFNRDDDDYLTRQLQFAKAAQKRMQEYSELQREVIQFVDMLKKDPRRALSDPSIGIDVKELARQVIEEEIENSKKTPDQIQREKLEKELQSMKDEREKEKEEFRQRELSRLREQEYERYDMLMTQALDTSDLPKSPYVVKKMADYMLLGLENGMDLTPEQVLPLVRDEIHGDIKEMFGAMPEEVIEQMIGKDVFNRVRKKSLAKSKQSTAPVPLKTSVKDTGQTTANREVKADKPKMTYKEFFKI